MSRISPKLATAVTIIIVSGFCAAAVLPSTALAARSVSLVGAWKGQLTASPTTDPGVLAVTDSGTGLAKDIGVFKLSSEETDSFVADTIAGGTFTISNSRGDSVHGTYAGTFSPISTTAVAFNSPGQITGGTGQLSRATGPITFTGVASASSLAALGGFNATIQLP